MERQVHPAAEPVGRRRRGRGSSPLCSLRRRRGATWTGAVAVASTTARAGTPPGPRRRASGRRALPSCERTLPLRADREDPPCRGQPPPPVVLRPRLPVKRAAHPRFEYLPVVPHTLRAAGRPSAEDRRLPGGPRRAAAATAAGVQRRDGAGPRRRSRSPPRPPPAAPRGRPRSRQVPYVAVERAPPAGDHALAVPRGGAPPEPSTSEQPAPAALPTGHGGREGVRNNRVRGGVVVAERDQR